MTNGPTCVYIYIAGLSKVPKKLSGWNCEGPGIYIYICTGWWCNNHLEKYEFVDGKDNIPYMKWNIKNVPNHQPVLI